jgi:serine/threonine protein phosphatase PrpC
MKDPFLPQEPAAPSTCVNWSGMTHVGKVRKNNEDAFLCITIDDQTFHYLGKEGEASLDNRDFIFAVSDGMGGAKAGEFASRIAVEKITRLLPKGYRSMASGLSAGFADLFEELYEEINKALNYLGSQYEECSGMGATLTLVWVVPGWLYFAHIGDSRLYYLPAGGGLKQLSEDHSHVGWLRRQGKINEREARSHPMRYSINRALGAGHQFVTPHVGSVGYEPGDLFLLCSDGITDGLWDRQLLQLLREPDLPEQIKSPAPRLVEAALERSGQDNLTAFVFGFR